MKVGLEERNEQSLLPRRHVARRVHRTSATRSPAADVAQHPGAKLVLALLSALDRLLPLGVAGPRRPVRLQLVEELQRDLGDVFHSVLARFLVGPRKRLEPAQLAHVLQRRSAHFVFGRGRLEVIQGLDVPAHAASITAKCWGLAFVRTPCNSGSAGATWSHSRP